MRKFETSALAGTAILSLCGFALAQQPAAPPPVAPAPATPPTVAAPAPGAPAVAAPAPPAAAAAPPAASAPPAPAVIDPGAQALLVGMAQAYKALKSFSATIAIDHSLGDQHQAITVAMKLVRPNRARILVSAGDKSGLLQSDGKSVFMMVPDNKTKYLKRPAPDGPTALAEILSTLGIDSYVVPLLAGYGPMDLYKGTLQSAVVEPSDSQGGVAVDRVLVGLRKDASHATVEFSIGHDDHLLRQVIGRFPQGTTDRVAIVSETHSDVRANPDLPDSTFVFTPPRGASEMALPQASPLPYSSKLKVGAPPQGFAANDTAGKTVSPAQYKGKVVLLDFWATWCAPCVAEMPTIIDLYKHYHARGLEIVGISLDNDYKAFTAFRASHNMPWREVYDGKGWSNKVAAAYDVQAIPLAILVGRDGRVAAIDPPGTGLAQAVAMALSKK